MVKCQDGGWKPYSKTAKRHNSAEYCPIYTNFGELQKITLTDITRSKSQSDVISRRRI